MSTALERLGYRPDDRVLVVHADDIGYSHASVAAFVECQTSGSITCGSILVPGCWLPLVAAEQKARPELDLGVHLTLTCEYERMRWRALTGRERGPGLYDAQGYLWRTAGEAVANVTVEEAELELRAQIDTALAAGIDVTHLDTHMGTVYTPKFLPLYVSLALEYRLPLFIERTDVAWLRERGAGEFADALEAQLRRLDEAGWPVLDWMIHRTLGEYEPEEKPDAFRRIFAELKPGLTHFLIHPASPGDELSAITESAPYRAADYVTFRDRSMRDYAESLGIKLTGYREIRDRLRAIDGSPA